MRYLMKKWNNCDQVTISFTLNIIKTNNTFKVKIEKLQSDQDQIVQSILTNEKKLEKENTEENGKCLSSERIKRFEEYGDWELANSSKLDYDIEKGNESFQNITEQLLQDNYNFYNNFDTEANTLAEDKDQTDKDQLVESILATKKKN